MTTESECVDALRAAAEALGESPTKVQYEELGLTPASGTIQRVMGGWNEAKDAAGLETYASHGSRVQPKPDDVDLPDELVWEDLTRYQRWHYKNREWNTERTLKRRARLREWIHKRKANSDGCRNCTESDPACLDFHHLSSADKEMAVNKMVPYGYSKSDIEAEMEKCEILCANCHAKEHVSAPEARVMAEGAQTRVERLRQWAYEYKRTRGCQRCPETDPVYLQFHHVSEKHAGVSEMIANGEPESDIRAEVEKCIVLCANCHRKEHYDWPTAPRKESDNI